MSIYIVKIILNVFLSSDFVIIRPQCLVRVVLILDVSLQVIIVGIEAPVNAWLELHAVSGLTERYSL